MFATRINIRIDIRGIILALINDFAISSRNFIFYNKKQLQVMVEKLKIFLLVSYIFYYINNFFFLQNKQIYHILS